MAGLVVLDTDLEVIQPTAAVLGGAEKRHPVQSGAPGAAGGEPVVPGRGEAQTATAIRQASG